MTTARLRHRLGFVALALAAALVCNPTTARAADSIRSAEWPLDASHFNAEKVWAVTKGEGVTVAVIDSGVSASHPDLRGQVDPGTSLLGDNGDGRTDSSTESHGTAIAGIIAGTGGPDRTGMTGLAPAARILPVRVSTGEAVAPALLARGITWAVDHGAKILNISMGTPQPDALLRQAVQYAIRKDVIVIASAGNSGQAENLPQYPAAFPGVVSVAGTEQGGALWAGSQWGKGIVLAAPATGIYSTNNQDAYVNAEGTSYAAAYVSATAALLRSHYPALSAGQVIHRMIDTTDHHHTAPDSHLGYGILAPYRALTDPAPPSKNATNPLLEAAVAPSSSRTPVWAWSGASAAAIALVAALAVLWQRRKKTPAANTPLLAGQRRAPDRPAARTTAKAGRKRTR